MRSIVITLLVAAQALAAQTRDLVVVASATTAPATSLFAVDLAAGTVQPIDRFSLDRFPPLAIAVDAVNRDVVVALQTPVGSSVLVRLRIAGARIQSETSLGDVPGIVTALTQALDGSWISTTAAGVLATQRNGSVPRSIVALPRAAAIQSFGLASTQAVVAQSGSASSDPQVRWLDLTSGQTIAGPFVYVGHVPDRITGVGDLPTGASRQVLSQEDGTVALSLNFQNPVPLPLQPILPAGATEAMHLRGLEGVVLGGRAHPYLKSFQALGGTQWTILAGPLAGDPIDFAFWPQPVATTVEFGGVCNRMMLREEQNGGPPRLGNAGYGLHLAHAQPTTAVFLALGASDQRFGALRLPATLPGGCQALVSAEVVLATTTNGFGEAVATLGIPNIPSLLGGIVYAQWLQLAGAAIDTSNAGAIWIGR